MRITYDPHADAAYIYFDKHPNAAGCVSETVSLSEDVAVDFGPARGGERGEVIGIEILSASENLGIGKDARTFRLEILGKPAPAAVRNAPSAP